MHQGIRWCTVFVASFASGEAAQTTPPSKAELAELLSKADEKVADFEKAVRTSRADLNKVDRKLAANYLEAAATTHRLIDAINKNGATAFRLVAVVTALDDLSLDAATGAFQLLTLEVEKPGQSGSAIQFALLLMTAKNACHDISELLMHATLGYLQALEERVG
jgi:hypothetical protein